ncbi:DUF3108 domain-containing protein [Ciceribacter sp. L1K22]|uniref:DUF3108 domain-containing protein n=1 Tax=Ciceribacter sp. L1K22 TaxID=2820275 RepID=UPI001ABE079C|nr:DUF3108 domain-containing protein [Ciceribacter sp. L1K22]MBO3762409.1 DUF3108 domain-containing protein [Ciceribacter sp. L1K22]
MLRIALTLTLAMAGLSPAFVQAEEVQSRTEYNISLAGIPIAKASFLTLLAARGYTISGSFRSYGIVNLVTDISAETSVSGVVRNENLQATSYRLVYRKGKKTETYNVRFNDGDVVSSEITPKPKARPKSWVPVTEAHLKAVLDPLSSLIIAEGEDVCPRTLPVFDGESRLDLVLSAKGVREYSQGEVKADAVVCGVRYIPRAGFRKGRKDIEYLSNVKGMEIWFAKAGTLPLYAPVRARIPTQYGPVDVTAVRFGS